MTRLLLSACALTIGATLAVSSWCTAEGTTTISILSPHDGDSVVDTFDITYEITNAPEVNHAHVSWMAPIRKGSRARFPEWPKGSIPSR